MKISRKTPIEDIATVVCEALLKKGISAILAGGGVVSILTDNEYESFDLDFVTHSSLAEIEEVLTEVGFKRKARGRQFTHPDTDYFIDFPAPPLAIGGEKVEEWDTVKSRLGRLQLLTPTHSAMDRLAAFYHWKDRQGLDQAVAIALKHPVKLSKIESWSKAENATEKYQEFLRLLKKRKSAKN